jgi:WD40 repeat protein
LVAVVGPDGPLPTGYAHAAAFSPDGAYLAVGTRGGSVRLLDVPDLECRREFAGHNGGVTALAFAPDGQTLASGGADGRVRRWSCDGTALPDVECGNAVTVQALAYAPDGRTLAVGRQGSVCLRPVGQDRSEPVAEIPAPGGPLFAAAFSPDGSRLAVGCGDNVVRLWRLNGGRPQLESVSDEQDYRVRALAFSPSGDVVAALDTEGGVTIRDAEGRPRGVRQEFGPSCLKGQFAADGHHILTVHGDGTARVLRLPRRWWGL